MLWYSSGRGSGGARERERDEREKESASEEGRFRGVCGSMHPVRWLFTPRNPW